MPIRGPFVIPRRSKFMWHLLGLYYFHKFNFPGSLMAYNRSPRRKPQKDRS